MNPLICSKHNLLVEQNCFKTYHSNRNAWVCIVDCWISCSSRSIFRVIVLLCEKYYPGAWNMSQPNADLNWLDFNTAWHQECMCTCHHRWIGSIIDMVISRFYNIYKHANVVTDDVENCCWTITTDGATIWYAGQLSRWLIRVDYVQGWYAWNCW